MIGVKLVAVLFGLLAAGAGTAPSGISGCADPSISGHISYTAADPGRVLGPSVEPTPPQAVPPLTVPRSRGCSQQASVMLAARAEGFKPAGMAWVPGPFPESAAKKYETVPFGDFESWATRNIRESGIIGGETKTIYNLGPTETINRNEPYDYSNTIWSSSNAYAVVMGVTKTSCSVTPAVGPDGLCARLQNCFAECKVAGIINIKVMVAGSLYWGRMHEPIASINDPYASMEWGIPFTKRPDALVVDYCATIPDSGTLTKGTTFHTETYPGHDPAEILLLLQNRWEDEQGNIHAKRVGTAFLRIHRSTAGWVRGRRIPVIYGDARKSAAYRPYMGLLGASRPLTAINSHGRSKVIKEEWGDPDTPVTHAIMIISSGSSGAFRGEIGNELLVDNLKLEYNE